LYCTGGVESSAAHGLVSFVCGLRRDLASAIRGL